MGHGNNKRGGSQATGRSGRIAVRAVSAVLAAAVGFGGTAAALKFSGVLDGQAEVQGSKNSGYEESEALASGGSDASEESAAKTVSEAGQSEAADPTPTEVPLAERQEEAYSALLEFMEANKDKFADGDLRLQLLDEFNAAHQSDGKKFMTTFSEKEIPLYIADVDGDGVEEIIGSYVGDNATLESLDALWEKGGGAISYKGTILDYEDGEVKQISMGSMKGWTKSMAFFTGMVGGESINAGAVLLGNEPGHFVTFHLNTVDEKFVKATIDVAEHAIEDGECRLIKEVVQYWSREEQNSTAVCGECGIRTDETDVGDTYPTPVPTEVSAEEGRAAAAEILEGCSEELLRVYWPQYWRTADFDELGWGLPDILRDSGLSEGGMTSDEIISCLQEKLAGL